MEHNEEFRYTYSAQQQKEVEAIRNRTNTGFCPMETAVWNIDSPEDAPAILLTTLANLQ
jgi:hypothetical protein